MTPLLYEGAVQVAPLHAGVLHDFHFSVCGCDACDVGVRRRAVILTI